MGTDFGWTTVQQNGCENCHAPHSAGGQQRLLNEREEEQICFACHNGNVASKNIQAQFEKPSRHRVEAATIGVTPNHHETGESPVMLTGHVECVDCHNPHVANELTIATPPAVSGKLDRVSGVDITGAGITPPNYAANEYEICFKCHASSSAQTILPPVPRVAKSVNTRVAFQTSNPSFHPVAGTGKNLDVPSIPSAYAPTLTAASMIFCTDCHDSDESSAIGGTGPRGPHGSNYSPLIREQYETTDNTIESPSAYALCYRCHNRSSILANDSFRKNSISGKGGHSGHLGSPVSAPCSVCHDPHGIQDDGLSGTHTNLINFDTRYVSALAASGNISPVFADNGSRAGSCTLVCHGVEHRAATHSYP
jgi:predicted CXXCH cytochrome family protein